MWDLSALNPASIAVAAIVSAALGAAWYSPVLFGPAWMQALGKQMDELGSPGPALGGSVFSCFVAATAVEILVRSLGIASASAGAGLGALLGFGVVAMTMLSDALFSGWGLRLYLIQVGYRAIYLVLMGTICGAFAA